MSTVLSKSQMKKVTLQELKQMALDVKYSLWNQAEANNRDVKLYVHWSGTITMCKLIMMVLFMFLEVFL